MPKISANLKSNFSVKVPETIHTMSTLDRWQACTETDTNENDYMMNEDTVHNNDRNRIQPPSPSSQSVHETTGDNEKEEMGEIEAKRNIMK